MQQYGGVEVQLHALCTRYLLSKRLGGPQSQTWYFGKQKNLLNCPGFEEAITTHSLLKCVKLWTAWGKQIVLTNTAIVLHFKNSESFVTE
jgi:hypothetical protein